MNMSKFLTLISLSLLALPVFTMAMESPQQHYSLASILHFGRLCSPNDVAASLDDGADPNDRGTEGITPLQIAVAAECPLEILIMLLVAGGNVHQTNNFKKSALTLIEKRWGSKSKDWPVKFLEDREKLLEPALRYNALWAVKKLITLNNVNQEDKDLMTPLGYAIRYERAEIVELLFSLGARSDQAFGKRSIKPLDYAREIYARTADINSLQLPQSTPEKMIITLLTESERHFLNLYYKHPSGWYIMISSETTQLDDI
jgi:ankyrin repeat protein